MEWQHTRPGPPPKRCDSCKTAAKTSYNRQYRLANRGLIRERQRAYKESNRDSIKVAQREYYLRKRDAILLQKQDYYRENRDSIRARTAQYRRENAKRYCEYVRARQAKQRDAFVAPVNHQAVFERDAGICGICFHVVDLTLRFPDPLSPTIDHIVPLSKGGVHAPENVQLAHLGCNSSKGARAS